MLAKDFVTIGLSSFALVVSVVSFILSYKQRSAENIRGIRKTLSEATSQLAEIALEVARLNTGPLRGSSDAVGFRRLYNSQRAHWANQAEYVISLSPSVANSVDYNILAAAFDAVGDHEKAQHHWENCIASPATPAVRAMHLRGYARFLFFQGNADLGRRTYQASAEVPLPATDVNRRQKADTYAMWSRVEQEFGHVEEAKRLMERATASANSIGHIGMREEFIASLNAPEKAVTLPTDEAVKDS